mmetsp:Transcript_92514/g.258634  ORF Transcript_92514/g.258634 Transcript_92514/m.258634 type:complete len:225 (-) Transcript_92514:119-793(-)
MREGPQQLHRKALPHAVHHIAGYVQRREAWRRHGQANLLDDGLVVLVDANDLGAPRARLRRLFNGPLAPSLPALVEVGGVVVQVLVGDLHEGVRLAVGHMRAVVAHESGRAVQRAQRGDLSSDRLLLPLGVVGPPARDPLPLHRHGERLPPDLHGGVKDLAECPDAQGGDVPDARACDVSEDPLDVDDLQGLLVALDRLLPLGLGPQLHMHRIAAMELGLGVTR